MSHKWKLSYDPIVAKQIAKAPDKEIRQALFDSLSMLAKSDNPLSTRGISKVQAMQGVWRIHVDTAHYAYRILFSITTGELQVEEITYKGTLHIHGVLPKNNNTYR